jgi:glycosyltransferase involved in cell wall biosynthesis
MHYREYYKDGVLIHKVRRLPFFCPPINGYIFRKLIHEIYKKDGLDAIISASFFNEVQPPLDFPLIYDFVDDFEGWSDIYATAIERFGLKYILKLKKCIHTQIKHAAAVTAVADTLVKHAKEINPAINIYKIVNGVDAFFLNTSLEKRGYDFGKHSMVYLSLFERWGNFAKIFEATKMLKSIYPDIKLVLIGDGEPVPEAKKLVKTMGMEKHIIFMGYVPHEKVPDIVNGCEIAVSPLKKDVRMDSCFPITIIEYTALGKKIVSSDLDEVKLLNFPNIFLYDENKGIEELVNAIETAFNTNIDNYATRRLACNYTWEGIAQEFRNILRLVIVRRKE